MPATVENRGSGTIVSPCPPSTNAWMFSTETLELHRDERAHAGRVEHAGHADHALAREAAQPVDGLAHRVERIGHRHDDARSAST